VTIVAANNVVTDIAEAVLASAVAGLVLDAVPLPERRYVDGGPLVAYDTAPNGGCEMLVVACERVEAVRKVVGGGQTGRAVSNPDMPTLLVAHYRVHAVTCWPSTNGRNLPDPDAITAASRRLWEIGFSARRGVVAATEAGTVDAQQPSGDSRSLRLDTGETGDLIAPTGQPSGATAALTFTYAIRV
jgi:hypothetical protein